MIRRAIVPVAVLAVAGLGTRACAGRRGRGQAEAARCCATCCSSATTGTAPPTCVEPAPTFKRARADQHHPRHRRADGRDPRRPERLGYFLAIRELVGEGHDQFVDDMFTLARRPAARTSRGRASPTWSRSTCSTGKIVWRTQVDGLPRRPHGDLARRHARCSSRPRPRKVVHVIDTATGQIVGALRRPATSRTRTTTPRDGKLIYHASIGIVYTPADDPIFDSTQGRPRLRDRRRAAPLQVLKQIDMGQKLDEAGYPDMSAAVRPMAITPDERYVYFQVSFFHGFVEYDLAAGQGHAGRQPAVRRGHGDAARASTCSTPRTTASRSTPTGTKLCVAGTMSDYAAIVDRATFAYTIVDGRPRSRTGRPTAPTARYCFVSCQRRRQRRRRSPTGPSSEVGAVPVGDHPQRMRMGKVRAGWLGTKKPRR